MRSEIRSATYFGTYDASYSRNRILIAGLRANGVHVEECHEELFDGTDGKLRAAAGDTRRLARLALRACLLQFRLVARFLRMPAADAVILGYSAHIDVFAAWVLTRLRGGVLVADIMTPLWLICRERYPGGVPRVTRFIVRALERAVILLSDVALVETREVAEFLAREYKVPASRFTAIPVGANPPVAGALVETRAAETGNAVPNDAFVVLYFGKFIPQHGIETILEAARVLRDRNGESVLFVLAGEGQQSAAARAFASQHDLRNVVMTGRVADDELGSLIRRADICLGVFGTTLQSRITAHNKVFEALTMGKPLISGRSPPIERLFRDGEELLLVERGDAGALAAAIVRLKSDGCERDRLARGATQALRRGGYLPKALARQLITAVRDSKEETERQ